MLYSTISVKGKDCCTSGSLQRRWEKTLGVE